MRRPRVMGPGGICFVAILRLHRRSPFSSPLLIPVITAFPGSPSPHRVREPFAAQTAADSYPFSAPAWIGMTASSSLSTATATAAAAAAAAMTSDPQPLAFFFSSAEEARAHSVASALSSSSSVTPARCGELACQKDSFLRTLGGCSVLGYALYEEDFTSPKVGNGGKGQKRNKKKEENATRETGGGKVATKDRDCSHSETSAQVSPLSSSSLRCALVLSDSVFFPEGGGQPSDRGRIFLRMESKKDVLLAGAEEVTAKTGMETIELSVLDGRNSDGICVLTCCPSGASTGIRPGALLDALTRSLPVDPASVASSPVLVEQQIDWPLRFDHMTQHSAQHLLSAIAASDEFGNVGTASFSLGTGEASTSYVDFEVGPDADLEWSRSLLQAVEDRANECIRKNLPMTPRYFDPSVESDVSSFGEKVRSRFLPEGLAGPIRLVEIGDGVDLNTCCGTHVPTLGHLQAVQLFRIEKAKGGVVRAHFAASERLRRVVRAMHERQSALTALLSVGEEGHVDRVKKMMDDARTLRREMEEMGERMRAMQARDVAKSCSEGGGCAAIDLGGGFDARYMTQLAREAAELALVQNGLEGGKDAAQPLLLLLVSSDGEDDEEGAFFLSGDAVAVDRLGKIVAEVLGGRGGGKNGRFQGKGTKIQSGLDDALRLLEKEIRSAA